MLRRIELSRNISISISQGFYPLSFISPLLCKLKKEGYLTLKVTVQLLQLNVPITRYSTAQCNSSFITYITLYLSSKQK